MTPSREQLLTAEQRAWYWAMRYAHKGPYHLARRHWHLMQMLAYAVSLKNRKN